MKPNSFAKEVKYKLARHKWPEFSLLSVDMSMMSWLCWEPTVGFGDNFPKKKEI